MIYDNIQCLVDKGFLSEEDGNRLKQLIGNMPNSKKDITQLLIGLTIITDSSSQNEMTYSNNDPVTYSNDSVILW